MKDELSIRGELLDLLPDVGRRFGLRRAALDHLVWLIRRTRVMDWRPGNRAVVYLAVSEIAAERGITPRQINQHERDIADALGCWVCSPHCRRYAQRDKESGRIVHASGFELTKLHDLLPELRRAKASVEAQHDRRRRRRRELAEARGMVRRLADAVVASGEGDHADTATRIAARIGVRVTEQEAIDVSILEVRLLEEMNAARQLEGLLLMGKTCGSDAQSSELSEENFRHKELSLDPQSTLKGGCAAAEDISTRRLMSQARSKALIERRGIDPLVCYTTFVIAGTVTAGTRHSWGEGSSVCRLSHPHLVRLEGGRQPIGGETNTPRPGPPIPCFLRA